MKLSPSLHFANLQMTSEYTTWIDRILHIHMTRVVKILATFLFVVTGLYVNNQQCNAKLQIKVKQMKLLGF